MKAAARQEPRVVARPFIKAVGGKTSSLELLLKYVPKKINRYFEPMLGGGALFFALANEDRFDSARLNDLNLDLISAYTAVRANPKRLILELKEMKNTKKNFMAWRAYNPAESVVQAKYSVKRAARFIFLNKTAFNGIWRVNRKGEFNVPFGHYKNPTICDRANLVACSKLLQTSFISSKDFEEAAGGDLVVTTKDFIYFDPPYVPVDETSNFVSFTSAGFKKIDHERLALHFTKLAKRRIPMMLSNSDTPLARKLYKGFDIVKTKVRRNVNSKGDGRGPVGEILVLANL